jgi:hypothetical protein
MYPVHVSWLLMNAGEAETCPPGSSVELLAGDGADAITARAAVDCAAGSGTLDVPAGQQCVFAKLRDPDGAVLVTTEWVCNVVIPETDPAPIEVEVWIESTTTLDLHWALQTSAGARAFCRDYPHPHDEVEPMIFIDAVGAGGSFRSPGAGCAYGRFASIDQLPAGTWSVVVRLLDNKLGGELGASAPFTVADPLPGGHVELGDVTITVDETNPLYTGCGSGGSGKLRCLFARRGK